MKGIPFETLLSCLTMLSKQNPIPQVQRKSYEDQLHEMEGCIDNEVNRARVAWLRNEIQKERVAKAEAEAIPISELSQDKLDEIRRKIDSGELTVGCAGMEQESFEETLDKIQRGDVGLKGRHFDHPNQHGSFQVEEISPDCETVCMVRREYILKSDLGTAWKPLPSL
jgi:hypothetical protein